MGFEVVDEGGVGGGIIVGGGVVVGEGGSGEGVLLVDGGLFESEFDFHDGISSNFEESLLVLFGSIILFDELDKALMLAYPFLFLDLHFPFALLRPFSPGIYFLFFHIIV